MPKRQGRSFDDEHYPFEELDEQDRFQSITLQSASKRHHYWLTKGGWYMTRLDAFHSSLVAEGDRTVIQTARETELVDRVLQLTQDAIDKEWISAKSRSKLRKELAAAIRAKADGKLP
jgi:hypothetical protein